MGVVRSLARRQIWALLLAFALAAVALVLFHGAAAPRYRLSARAAIAAARTDSVDARYLRGYPASRARSIPLDASLRRVTFFAGPRVVLDAAVNPQGEVVSRELHPPGVPQSGGRLANSPWVLALLTGLFALAAMVAPLARLRNLDVLAMASFTATIALINARLVAASVVTSSLALAYLAGRCLWVGLRTSARGPSPSTPLYDWLTSRWDVRRSERTLGLVVIAAALVMLMIVMTSSGESDVAAASLSGATDLLHGVLPYGHIHDAVHGDTYPLLNYVLYIPGAAWLPVTDAFSDLTGALPIAAASALLVALAMRRLAPRQSTDDRRGWLRGMLAWLAFPPMVLAAAGGSNDLVLAGLLAWLLVFAAHRQRSMLLLAMAVWVKLVPLILLPFWLSRYKRGEGARALIGPLALSVALGGCVVALGGVAGVGTMLRALAFQFQRASFYAPWYTFGLQWLQPILQAVVLTALLAAVLGLRRDPSLRTDRMRLAAIGGALLLGVQLTANYWTWSYLPWAFPFIAVALFMSPAPLTATTTIAAPRRRSRRARRGAGGTVSVRAPVPSAGRAD